MKHDRELWLAAFGAVFSVLLGYIGSAIENFSWTKVILIVFFALGTVLCLALIGTLGAILRRAPIRIDGNWILDITQQNGDVRSLPVSFRQSGARVLGIITGKHFVSNIKGELTSEGALLAHYASYKKTHGADAGTIYLRPTVGAGEFRGFYTGPNWDGNIVTGELAMKKIS